MATASDTRTCYRHPDRETGVSCSSCGRPICPSCMTPTPVGMRCPECSKQTTNVRRMRASVGSDALTVTIAIIVVNVIAFVASGQFTLGGGGQSTTVYDHGVLYGPLVTVKHEYWRLVTGGFLHEGFLHIGFNMYLLFILGQQLEPTFGRLRFGLIYFVALLAGSAGALVLNPNTPTLGASGAVFGLMGFMFLEQRHRGINPMQTGIGTLILINLVFSFVWSNVSIGGHIGGLIGGGLLALAFQNADRIRRPELGYVAAVAVGVASVALALVAAKHGYDTGHALI